MDKIIKLIEEMTRSTNSGTITWEKDTPSTFRFTKEVDKKEIVTTIEKTKSKDVFKTPPTEYLLTVEEVFYSSNRLIYDIDTAKKSKYIGVMQDLFHAIESIYDKAGEDILSKLI